MSAQTGVLFDLRVADFDTFKKIFDANAEAHREASAVAIHVNRGIEDENRVIVFMIYTDDASMKAFVSSELLQQAMAQAGVLGPPAIQYTSLQSDDAIWDRVLPGAVVAHQVESYPRFRMAYDEADALRRDHDIIGHAVNRAGPEGNEVIVYLQAETADALSRFLALPDLRSAMAEGGVLEAPRVTLVTGGL